MTMVPRAFAIGLMLAAAAPVVAQTPPPAPGDGRMMQNGEGRMMRHGGKMHGNRAFASMSEAGRATMREAMRGGSGDARADHDKIKAARDRMLTLLEANRLDTAALKRTMEEERNIANASRERRQAAMLEAFGKLSVADRKAFVADSRAMKSRMEERVQKWRERRGNEPPPLPPAAI